MRNILYLLLLFTLVLSSPEIIGYWEGYDEYSIQPYPIELVSENVTIIQIAFIAPASPKAPSTVSTQWSFGISTVTYNPRSLRHGIKLLQARSQRPKILLSIMDTPQVSWSNVDIEVFSYNLLTLIEDWDLDGVNIDAESSMPYDVYVQTFITLVQTLRRYLGPNRLLTYSTYGQTEYDTAILNVTKQDIDILQTLSYWSNATDMISTFEWYGNVMNDTSKIALGFAVNMTNLMTIQQTGHWLATNGYNKTMLWSLTQDVEAINGYPDGTYIDTMYASLS